MRLQELTDGVLGLIFQEVLKIDPLRPVLADRQFQVVNRRLAHVMTEIKNCITRKRIDNVIVNSDDTVLIW